jgi:hypothetical protein
MHHPFVPLLLLVLVPLGYFLYRLGCLQRNVARGIILVCGGLIVAVSVFAGGSTFLYLKRIHLLVAVATALIVWLRHSHGVLADQRHYLRVLGALAVVAWITHLNFFSFHGARTYLHLHDVAHYYLGSKYFAEIGYGELYIAMLRAEAERYDNHFKAIEARDLEEQGLVHIRALLERSPPVKARFTPERWEAFQRDVAFFRDAMGNQYGEILRDHGFNPTPAWALFGGALANAVPAGSHGGILLLTLIDPVLEAGMFLAIAWTFGVEIMLLCMVYFCVLFGASFGFVGGAYLRYMSLFSMVVSACCLQRRCYASAGALLAWAALLRVFPAILIVPIVCKAASEVAVTRRIPRHYMRLLLSFSATAALLVASTAVLPKGFQHWRDFTANTQRHLRSDAYNTVGLTELLVYRGATKPSTAADFSRATDRRSTISLVQLLTIFPLTLLFVARRSRHEDDLGALAMGILLLFTSLSLASYYYTVLLLIILARRDEPTVSVLLFAVEAAIYTLQLFEDRHVVLYFYRNVLLAYVLVAIYLQPIQRELSAAIRLCGRRRREHASADRQHRGYLGSA